MKYWLTLFMLFLFNISLKQALAVPPEECPAIPGIAYPRDLYGCPAVPSGENVTNQDILVYDTAWRYFTESYKPNLLLSWFDEDYSSKNVKTRCPKWGRVGPGYPEDCLTKIGGGPLIDTPAETETSVAATNYLNSLKPETRDSALTALAGLTTTAQSNFASDTRYAENFVTRYYYWLRAKYPPNTVPRAVDLKRVDDRGILVGNLLAAHALTVQVKVAAIRRILKSNGSATEVIGSTNGDAYSDLVTLDVDTHIVNCYVRNPNGKGYALVQQIAVQGVPGLNLIDKNRDKRLDLVLRYVAADGSVSESIYFGTGNGTFFPGVS